MCTEIEKLNLANNYSWLKKVDKMYHRRKKLSVGFLECKDGRGYRRMKIDRWKL